MNDTDKQLLVEIRKNPRKMHQKYLQSTGLLSLIDSVCDERILSWPIRDKIDHILAETKPSCSVCSSPVKVKYQWCSIACRNKDPNIRVSIGKKNRENKLMRSVQMKKTLKERYGVESVQSIPSAVNKTRAKKAQYHKETIENTFQSYSLNLDQYSDFSYLESICKTAGCYKKLSQNYFNDMPIMTIHRHFQRIEFDPQFDKSSSMGEREIAEFVESLGVNTLRNDRTAIKPKELDVYIPEKQLAIEYNGLYWHSNDSKSSLNKLKLCQEKNIKLLQFYEDEWILQRPIIESIIRSKLGLSERFFARNTVIKKVAQKEAWDFLEENHLQGKIAVGSHYGLYDKQNPEILLCLASVGKHRFNKKSKSEFELFRFATRKNMTVVGGFTKLILHIKTELNIESILTYADLRYSTGNVYSQNGTYSHDTKPGYFWVHPKKNIRVHRYATQKSRLSDLLGSMYDSAKSESENMIQAGFYKIFDCGNRVYRI